LPLSHYSHFSLLVIRLDESVGTAALRGGNCCEKIELTYQFF